MKKNNIILLIIMGIILAIGRLIFIEDYIFLIKWLFTLFLIGIIFYPLTLNIFKKFHDGGWIFSKVIGIAISSWIMWLLSYMKILKYTNLNCYIIIAILLIINVIIAKKNHIKINNEKLKNILISEIIFIAIFMCWMYIRGMSPQIDSISEKYMDYGYMNATMNSEYMPAEDIWYSGEQINYYYYGQYVSGFITKIANLQVNEGYNLMLAFIGTLTFILPYIIGYNLTIGIAKNDNKKVIPIITAIIIGLSISIGGSLHYPIYRWILNSRDTYYYPDTTRYIGYNPDTDDKALTEVPIYTGILGDLHAHYIDLIFSFVVLGILLEIMLCDKEKNFKQKIFDKKIFLLGFILGIQKMTNYWDLPIYFVIMSVIIIYKNLLRQKLSKSNIIAVIIQIIELIFIEEFITIPFTKDLYISTTQVYFTDRHTKFYQYSVLWGLPISITILFFIYLVYKYIKTKNKKNKWINEITEFFKDIEVLDAYIIILMLCSIGLIILPEIIYLKDIYNGTYERFNTVFKLTYNAYVIFSISSIYVIIKMFHNVKKWEIRILIVIILIMQLSTIPYGINIINTKYKESEYVGISNTELYIKEILPDDYKAIQWIKTNIKDEKVILEKAGNSYSSDGRISVFTAHPTILGWYAHEWQWRANENHNVSYDENIRWQDVYTVYTEKNIDKIKQVIEKYNISYIYIGNLEFMEYKIDINTLLNLGEIVFEIGQDECIKTPVYIIKVK
mgnify:CR=1 FL=1